MHDTSQNAYVRLLFLFAFFALSIGDTFNVLFIRELVLGFASPDRYELLISIPVTVMNAMMIAGVVAANLMIRRNGNIVLFLRISTIVSAAGLLIRGMSFHYYMLLLGFAVTGFGYGCFYIGIRYYAYLFDDEKERMETLAFISGGAFAGQCMGTVLGGIMAGQMPYRMVYLLAVIILVFPVCILGRVRIDSRLKVGSIRHSFRVFGNPGAVVYLLFMVLPLFACTIFTSYTVPLAINGFGYSATVISALLLGAYLITAYAGPFMTRLISSHMTPIRATLVYCAGVAILITVYTFWSSFAFLVVVVLALGLMDSFGLSVMTEAYTDSKRDSSYSDADALMVYILITRLGMTIAPGLILVFGTTLALSGSLIIGMALFLLSGTVFVAASGKRGK